MCQCSPHRACCKIQPSMLACDLANMASEAKAVLAAGADELHLDVMDGHFVPNISFSTPVITSLRKSVPDAYFDVHMMVSKPSQWVTDIAKAGGNRYVFHAEAVETDDLDLAGVCDLIRANGMQVGVAIKPGTGVEALSAVAALVDMVLVMTVEVSSMPRRESAVPAVPAVPSRAHPPRTPADTARACCRFSCSQPGFGGQKFQPNMMSKVLTLRTEHPAMQIQVDGGLSPATVDEAAAAGANMIVAGSAVFKPGTDPAGPISVMRKAVLKRGQGLSDEAVEQAMAQSGVKRKADVAV